MKQRDGPGDDLSVSIDPFHLDREWTAQPDRMQKAGDLLADAKDRADRAKSKLDVVKATVELMVRKKPSAFGLDKLTEPAVAAAVVASDQYQEAMGRFNKAKHRAALLGSLVDAMEQRKAALENLVKLHLAGYYSEPKAPRGATRDDALKMAAREIDAPMPEPRRKKKRWKHRGGQA
jgi:hypothetical protein